jgi:mRNA-degrading endonuclease RelE of RelBE toxin-antitoxin system
MSFDVRTIVTFERQLKALAKKYPSLRSDFALLLDQLESDPIQGVGLGNSCRKIRMAITSKNKGRSGGARVIIHIAIRDRRVWLLTIYDKSEVESISTQEIKLLLDEIPDR